MDLSEQNLLISQDNLLIQISIIFKISPIIRISTEIVNALLFLYLCDKQGRSLRFVNFYNEIFILTADYFLKVRIKSSALEIYIPLMRREKSNNTEIHQCSFEVALKEAEASIKFPCRLLVIWKTHTGKCISKTKSEKIVQNGAANLNESFSFRTFLVFQKDTEAYMRKQTSLCLYMISPRKPDQQKMLGRVTIDLASVFNQKAFEVPVKHRLQFCSVKNGGLIFSIKNLGVVKTDKTLTGLDLDDFIQIVPEERRRLIPSSLDLEPEEQIEKVSARPPKRLKDISISPFQMKDSEQLAEVNSNQKKILPRSSDEKQKLEFQVKSQESKGLESEHEIVQQLLTQVREQTEKRIKIQNSLKKINEKLEEDLKQSEQKRLDFESQLLQLRFQLSELKNARESKIVDLGETPVSIKKKPSKKDSLTKKKVSLRGSQLSELSNESCVTERERESYNAEISQLHQQVRKLTNQLHFTESAKEKFESYVQTIGELNDQKERYFEELKMLQRQKFQLQEEKKQLEEKLMKPGDSIMMEQLVEKLTYLQNQFDMLKMKLSDLEDENILLVEEIKNLEKENQTIKKEEKKSSFESLEKILQQKSQLENQLAENKVYLTEKQKIFYSTQDQIKGLLEEKKVWEMESKRLQQQNKRLEGQWKSLKRTKDEEILQLNSLKHQVIELDKVRAELSAKNVRLQNDNKSYELKFEKVKREEKLKQAALNQKRDQIVYLNRQIQEQIQRNQDMEMKMSEFAEKQIAMRQNIQVLEEQTQKVFEVLLQKQDKEYMQGKIIEEKTAELENLKLSYEELKIRYHQSENQKKQLSEKLYKARARQLEDTNLKTDKQIDGEANPEIFSNEKKYRDLAELYKERIIQLQSHSRAERGDLYKQIEQLTSKLNKQKKQRDNLQKYTLASLEKEKIQLQRKNTQLSEKMRKNYNSCLEKDQKLKNLEENIERSEINHKKLVEHLKQKNKFAETRIMELEKSVERHEDQIKEQKLLIEKYLKKLEKLAFQRAEAERGKIKKDSLSKISSSKNFSEFNPDGFPMPSVDVLACDIVEASSALQELLKRRAQKDQTEAIMEQLVSRNASIEEGMSKVVIERGVIQETARTLSMEIAKLKTNALKGRGGRQEKKAFVDSLRPCQQKVKQLVSLSENLSNIDLEVLQLND